MDEVKEKIQETKKPRTKKKPSKSERKKKEQSEKRGVWFLVILGVSVVLFFLVLILFPIGDREKISYTYNGFEFTEFDGTWYTKGYRDGNEFLISLRNGPKDLEDIPVSGKVSEFWLAGDFYYITFDPRDENHDKFVTMSMTEIAPNLVVHFNKEISPACTVEHPSCVEGDAPVLTCEDTDVPVIYLKREPGPKVEIKDNCAIIQGEGDEMVQAANRFLYGLYGIMQNE